MAFGSLEYKQAQMRERMKRYGRNKRQPNTPKRSPLNYWRRQEAEKAQAERERRRFEQWQPTLPQMVHACRIAIRMSANPYYRKAMEQVVAELERERNG